jgi:Xaa-Pro aminopeptidase
MALIRLDPSHVGRTSAEKLAQIREQLDKTDTELTVLTSLDEIAWTLNMRGRDIPFGAVFFSYLIVEMSVCRLFTRLERLTDELRAYLLEVDKFTFHAYDEFYVYYEQLVRGENLTGKRIFLSSLSNNLIHSMVPSSVCVHKDLSIVAKLKMIKNERELHLAHHVHLKDSAVLCEFFYKLDEQFSIGNSGGVKQQFADLSEFEVAEFLDRMRCATVGSMGPSFETICGFGANGAIIHYKPKQGESKVLERGDLLLVDSGGHYLDMGTTDVTRTVFLGDPAGISDYQRECFTLVLKGNSAKTLNLIFFYFADIRTELLLMRLA